MKFAHTNIVAMDYKKLVDFYINVFECRIKPPKREMSGEWLDNATGIKNARLEGYHLILPGYGDNGPTLEIFTYKETKDSSVSTGNKKGFSHIAFGVDDVDLTFEKALAHGGKKLGNITEKEVEGVGTLKFVYLRDPEDNIIEIQSWNS